MNLKKIPYYLALLLLTSGASLILGFLSFGGMFALWPILPLAFTAFVLSVAYEGEIYLQNIKGALNKLFKHHYLERQLGNEYLLNNFPNPATDGCPQFFADYDEQLNLLHQFGHKRLDKESSRNKKRVEKTLRDMEKWFAIQLFHSHDEGRHKTQYEITLHDWLERNGQSVEQDRLAKRQQTFRLVSAFSILAGVFMGLGTTYLLVEAFTAIPFFTAISLGSWPLLIVPMSIIAGAAYGLLTYNSVTDMISNDTLRKWYDKIRTDLSQGLTLRNGFIAVTAVVLVALAFALTICTAGTWWTVAQETRPLFAWMARMPSFIMGVINPLITGFSAIVFNLQNTSESLALIDDATRTKGNVFKRMGHAIRDGFNSLMAQENWLQIINPFRLLLKLTIMPLRILLFLGHLISIGVTADRVPGVSKFVSALLGIISEGFEDAHYFIAHDHYHADDSHEGHDHGHHDHQHHDHDHHDHQPHDHRKERLQHRLGAGHSHNHDVDLPTRALKLIFMPVYVLATAWDVLASKRNDPTRRTLSFNQAWDKQMGISEEHTVAVPQHAERPSSAWKVAHTLFRIERHKEKHLQDVWLGADVAVQKSQQLTNLQNRIRQQPEEIDRLVNEEASSVVYATHRFFNNGTTSTSTFLQEELPQRVNGPM